MAVKTLINGIDLEEMQAAMKDFKAQPQRCKFVFKAHNRWIDRMHNQAEVDNFVAGGKEDTSRTETLMFDEDEPPALLGQNLGANPVEYVLVALSGCLTTALVMQAAVKGIDLEQVECELEGDLDVRGALGIDPGVRNGYEQIRVKFRIDAPGATQQQLDDLVRSAKARSPVFDIASNGVPVSVELQK